MKNAILSKWRSEGLAGFVLSIVHRLPGVRAVCAYTHFDRPVGDAKISSDLAEPYTLNLIANLEAGGAAIVQVRDSPDLFAERFRRGDVCVLACTPEGEGLGYMWAQLGGVHREERYGFPIPVGSGRVYYYDVFVRNEFRGSGLFRALLRRLEVYAQEAGASELCAIVELQNKRSNVAHCRLGMLPRRKYVFLDLHGWTVHRMIGR